MGRMIKIKDNAGGLFAGRLVREFADGYRGDLQDAMLKQSEMHWLKDNSGKIVELIRMNILDNSVDIIIDGMRENIPYYCVEEIEEKDEFITGYGS